MKNKARAQTKRRQAAAQKTKQRAEKIRQGKHQPTKGKRALPPVTTETFTDAAFKFWLAHGANYILSSYTDGTWTPLFPTIYEGACLEPDFLARTVMSKFNADPAAWPPEAKAALAWTVQDRASVYIYQREATRRLRSNDPACNHDELCLQPHNPIVWQLFDFLRQKLLQRKVI